MKSTNTLVKFLTALALCLPGLAGPITGAVAGERWSQLADPVFKHWDQDEGLSHPIVSALAEDGDGFLWVGMVGGLARWDGYRFRDYVPNPGAPDALPDNYILCLHTDTRGRLWIGTNAGGLALYDRDHDRFRTFAAGPGGLGNAKVRAITDDGTGSLWVATDGGLDRLDPDTGTVTPLRHDDKDPTSLPAGAVMSLLRDQAGALWVGTRKGLVRRDPGASGFTAVALPAPEGTALNIRSLLQDSAGRVWVGTSNRGAFVIEPGREARAVQETSRAAEPLETAWIFAMAEAAPGEIWLDTFGQGIVIVDTTTWRTRRIRHDPTLPTSLAHDDVWALYRGRSGLLWVGGVGGLSRHDPGQTMASTIYGGTSRTDSLSEGDVTSIMAAADGRVWLGLRNNGVDIIDPVGVRVGAIRPDAGKPLTALPLDSVWGLVQADTGDVYIGTGKGLYRTDPTGRQATRIMAVKQTPNLSIRSLHNDGSAIWIGGSADGIWRLAPQAGDTADPSGEGKLTDPWVQAVAPGPNGQLWLGTRNGLNRLDTASGAIEQILPITGDPRSLSAGFVTSVLTDGEGRLWAGTLGDGINVLEGRDADGQPRFRRLGTADGLPNNAIAKLLADKAGRIWASTANGLAVIDPKTFAVRALRRAEGVALSGYWTNSGTITAEGELLFGGRGGVTVVRPDRLAPWTYRPPVVVTDIRVGGHPVPGGKYNGPGTTAPLVVAPDANSLAVEFASLGLSAPERLRYAYRLEGFDKDWIETDWTRRQAAYTNLPPGTYTLRLRGSNRDGVWTENPLAVPVRVLPAWHQTIWFQLALAMAAAHVVVAIVQGRTAYLRHRQVILRQEVANRTAELQLRTDELVEAHRQLEQIAYIDMLTSLPNRRMLTAELRKLIAQTSRQGGHFVLLLLDLDRFKQINDTMGHDAGDALLVEAAARFKACVRTSDFVARLGGDEFAILLTGDDDRDGIDQVCQRIVDRFVEPVMFKDNAMRTSPSIGVAVFPDMSATEEGLFKAADLALYAAKRAGRNTWRWYEPPMAGSDQTFTASPPKREA